MLFPLSVCIWQWLLLAEGFLCTYIFQPWLFQLRVWLFLTQLCWNWLLPRNTYRGSKSSGFTAYLTRGLYCTASDRNCLHWSVVGVKTVLTFFLIGVFTAWADCCDFQCDLLVYRIIGCSPWGVQIPFIYLLVFILSKLLLGSSSCLTPKGFSRKLINKFQWLCKALSSMSASSLKVDPFNISSWQPLKQLLLQLC